ncbi:OTU-like cysteine protease [Trifolium medium]|uniref:OTU-like cysteine protease n=1 Tax=Trifolium medium TaxID=97028 RepID=A0A392RDS1_9FABA|nr:OTU-like cysteine protease [Trifolium medium]
MALVKPFFHCVAFRHKTRLQKLFALARYLNTVLVKLQEGCPIPPTNGQWKRHCCKETLGWESSFTDMQQRFEELMSIERGGVTIVGEGSRDMPMVID